MVGDEGEQGRHLPCENSRHACKWNRLRIGPEALLMSDDLPKNDPLYVPLTEDERLTIRGELRDRKWQLDERRIADGKEGSKLFAQHHHAVRLHAIGVSAEFGKIFVRFALLLNGGAMIALLTLIGALHGRADQTKLAAVGPFTDKLQFGMQFFIAGLVLAALTAGLAFFAWRFVAATYFHEGHTSNSVSASNLFGGLDREEELKQFDKYDRYTDIAMWFSAILGTASLVCFTMGTLKVAKAFAFFSALR